MRRQKIVYLVRHAESSDNAAPVYQRYHSPLSSTGKMQALNLAARIKRIQFDVLVSSPQLRAKETANAIAVSTDTPLEMSDLFIERRKPASIEGKSWTDSRAANVWKAWEKSLITPMYRVEDGENYDDIVRRADAALSYIENRSESSLVVVSHGHFIRTILARILLGDKLTGNLIKQFYDLISLENTSITVLKHRDAYEEDFCWRVWTVNDYAHLTA